MAKFNKKFIRELQWRIECARNRVEDIKRKKHRMLTSNEVESTARVFVLLEQCRIMIEEKIGKYVLPEKEKE